MLGPTTIAGQRRHHQSRILIMRRWVFAFLLFVMPFQWAWGAAAPYCAHEASVAAKKHFGHHEHEHQAGSDLVPATSDAADASGAFQADCESCLLACAEFMPAITSAIDTLPHGDAMRQPEPCYDSHIPASPLRPDRAHSTAAARSGGDVVMVSLAD